MDNYIQQRFGPPSKTNVYILQLEQNKYYIGKTDNVNKRYQEHVDGKGCGWTRLFRPISIFKTINDCNVFDEDRYTKEMMAIHGIDNVRGGTYCNIVLSSFEKSFIQKEIWSAQSKCCRCGRNNHWISNCKELTDINGRWIL